MWVILLTFVPICLFWEFGTDEYNKTMFWGSYQPQFFFGMKTRSEFPVKIGMVWNHVNRHEIRHESDSGMKYGWNKHDGREFGNQRIVDVENNVVITTKFVKEGEYSENGGNVFIRVQGEFLKPPVRSSSKKYLALGFYFAIEDDVGNDKTDYLEFKSRTTHKGATAPVIISGKHEHTELGNFKFFVKDNNDVDNEEKFKYYSVVWPKEYIWDVKKLMMYHYGHVFRQKMKGYQPPQDHDPRNGPPPMPKIAYNLNNTQFAKIGNLIIIQKNVRPPFQFDIVYLHEDYFKKTDKATKKYVFDELMGDKIGDKMKEAEKNFDIRFKKTFPNVPKKHRKMGKFALSNLLGGIGYFSGDCEHEIDAPNGEKKIVTKNMVQFTAVPSRSKFPRSFLWDSGFQLEVVLKWDAEIGKDILHHWYSSMYDNGWIPREQILGEEGRSRVPEKFQLQRSDIANPPTLFMAIENNLLPKKVEIDEFGQIEDLPHLQFLENMYPLLKTNYEWYYKTQVNPRDKNSFQWRGRTVNHTLASGFDDYPFSVYPVDSEKHLDLYCWMFMISRTMMKLSSLLGYKDDFDYFEGMYKSLESNFYSTHYDETQNIFANYVGVGHNGTSFAGYSPQIGYVSLFPLISEITRDNLRPVLQAMIDKDQLFSNAGLRSLSKQSNYYGTNENYWRGKVWVNINFMVLKSLKKWVVEKKSKTMSKVYSKIRNSLIENIARVYSQEKTLFENYHPETGKGTGTSPFTGWTSLVLLIIDENY